MYQLRPPAPALAPFIEHYWFVQGHMDLTVDVFVDARADLIFNFAAPYTRKVVGGRATRQTKSNLDAQRTKAIKIVQKGDLLITGVRFKTGGLAPFARVSVHEWNNKLVSPRVLDALRLEKQLAAADIDAGKQLLDAHFERRLKITPAVQTFIAMKDKIEAGGGLTRMDGLGVPARQLARLFKRYLGFSPKTFARIVRFQTALRRLRSDPGCTLAQVAAECGYYDQSHFVRDHRAYAGVAPKRQVGYFPAGAPSDFSPNLVQFVQDGGRKVR